MKLSPKAQAALDRVVNKFKQGDLSPITEVVRLRLGSEAPASRWTFSNQVLAYAQTGELDCRGYRQWQQVGRQVKKGALGVRIGAHLGHPLVALATEFDDHRTGRGITSDVLNEVRQDLFGHRRVSREDEVHVSGERRPV